MARKGLLTTANHLPYNEYLRLLECLDRNKKYLWELYAVLGFSTGMRASDVLSLYWCDILDRDYIKKCEKKTQKVREIKISQPVRNTIKHLYNLLDSPDKNDYVFLNTRTALPYTIWTVNREIKKFKFEYKINIRAFSSHTYRKTLGRYVYDLYPNKSEGLLMLQKMLNHTNSQTTIAYIGLVQSDIDRVYDSISLIPKKFQ